MSSTRSSRRATCSIRARRLHRGDGARLSAGYRVGRAAARDRSDPRGARGLTSTSASSSRLANTAGASPRPTRIVARRRAPWHCTAAECLAIEDSRWGIESAKAAGLRCVGDHPHLPAQRISPCRPIIDSLAEFTPALISSPVARREPGTPNAERRTANLEPRTRTLNPPNPEPGTSVEPAKISCALFPASELADR